MQAKVFINGCACGAKARQVALVRSKYPNVKVYNTKYSYDLKQQHVNYLENAGMGVLYQSIVVEDGVTTLLSEWKP